MDAKKLQLNPEIMEKIKISSAEFDSTLIASPLKKLEITEESNILSPDQCASTARKDGDDKGAIILDESASVDHPSSPTLVEAGDTMEDLPESDCAQPPRPAPVSLGACFSCGKVCDRRLSCAQHRCTEPCHLGECKPCSLDPLRCLTCPCGRVALSKLIGVFRLFSFTPPPFPDALTFLQHDHWARFIFSLAY
ncbi:unnamed protein product [Echinostoma caproni]|uniref:CXC domain-containing protein n=1 Tax=Echinostoma caproni TaxID=27848 RepID=A0A183AX78_9TREM|nr:unnamed protein product [Echinostoma caproni]